MSETSYEYDDLDACDQNWNDLPDEEVLHDDELELFPLFAEALDPNSPKTVEQVKAEWEELFGAAPDAS